MREVNARRAMNTVNDRLTVSASAHDVAGAFSVPIESKRKLHFFIGSSGNRVDESNGKCGLKPHEYWVFEVS
jgi:hypothetical protein